MTPIYLSINLQMNTLYIRVLCFAVFSFFFSVGLRAQTTFQIIDESTKKPVEGASYQCGKQKGQSDSQGKIFLKEHNPEFLLITHIGYLTKQLSSVDIQKAVNRGWIGLVPAENILLNPVTVYALKGKAAKDNKKLTNGEWIQHDAGQVLQQIPGFSAIRKSGDFGFDPVFRGGKADQIAVLTDGGLTSLAACPNRMDPPTSQVLISQTEVVEILKGPHSFRYGPVTTAIINFKTTDPEFSHCQKLFGRVNGGLESNGGLYRIEGLAGIRTQNMQWAAVGSYSKGQSYKDGKGSVIPAGFARGSLGLQADFNIKQKNILSFAATRSYARKVDFPTLMMDLLTDDSWMLQGRYKVKYTNKQLTGWNTQVYASFVDHLMGNNHRPETGKMADAETAVNTRVFGGRTEMVLKSAKSEAFIGLDGKYEQEDGNRVRSNIRMGPMKGKTVIDTVWQNSNIARVGVFGEWHYQLLQYKLALSGRLDLVHGTANNPSSKFKDLYPQLAATDVNPSLSIGISRQWHNNWFAGLWLGRGVRSAGITERFINSMQIGIDPFEVVGNPQLKPEANQQTDLMIGYKSSNTSIQWNGFASIVSNYISAQKTNTSPRFGAPGVRQFVNLDKALLVGFEFSWAQQYLPGLAHQVSAAYTYGKNKGNGHPLPQIAPFDLRYQLEGKLWKNRILPFAQLRWVAAQNRFDKDYGEVATPEFTTINMGIKTEIVRNFQVTASFNNLLNRAYREHLSRFIKPGFPLNSPGRSFSVVASYSF